MHTDPRPIGIFDSGIGGLTVMTAIRQALPAERLLYFGDNLHMPYGARSLDEVRAFSVAITGALLKSGCKLVVIACNTASAAALAEVRRLWPDVPFVGMEPAVKPAVEQTASGVVGVIATTATFQSDLYASVVERFAQGVEVLHQPCPGLVEQIEAGMGESAETEGMLRGWLDPLLARNVDAIVLGCTHYPIVQDTIERIVGPAVRVINPASAIANRVENVLRMRGMLTPSLDADTLIYTSGDPKMFGRTLSRLGIDYSRIHRAKWHPPLELRLEPHCR